MFNYILRSLISATIRLRLPQPSSAKLVSISSFTLQVRLSHNTTYLHIIRCELECKFKKTSSLFPPLLDFPFLTHLILTFYPKARHQLEDQVPPKATSFPKHLFSSGPAVPARSWFPPGALPKDRHQLPKASVLQRSGCTSAKLVSARGSAPI